MKTLARRSLQAATLAAALSALTVGQTARAGGAAFPVLDIDITVNSLEFSGVGSMPLGPGFTGVDTQIDFTATAGTGHTGANGPNPVVQNGDTLFFDPGTTLSLTFNILFTDVDPTNDFAGNVPSFPVNGVQIEMDDVLFIPNCIASLGDPFFGCGMLLHEGFSDGDVSDVGPTNEGDDYDSASVNVPLPLGQDADNANGIDAITSLILELAFSQPLSTVVVGTKRQQTYNVSALLTGSINPDFGDPTPISLTGTAVVTPEPGSLALLGSLVLALGALRARRS